MFFSLCYFFCEKKVTQKSRPKSKTARFRVSSLIKLWCYCGERLQFPDLLCKKFDFTLPSLPIRQAANICGNEPRIIQVEQRYTDFRVAIALAEQLTGRPCMLGICVPEERFVLISRTGQ